MFQIKNALVAYDIDGVLVPDFMTMNGREPEFYEKLGQMRALMMPMFQPSGKYVLLTARCVKNKPVTEQWIDSTFQEKPIELIHNSPVVLKTVGEQAEYKIGELNKRTHITHFIESDPAIARLVKTALPKLQVYTFNDLMAYAFKSLNWGV